MHFIERTTTLLLNLAVKGSLGTQFTKNWRHFRNFQNFLINIDFSHELLIRFPVTKGNKFWQIESKN